MPVKRRHGKQREALPAEAEAWLAGGSGGSWCFLQSADELATIWRDNGGEIVQEHATGAPGSRPARWWRYTAPGPRVRCGGIGTPCHERLAHVLRLHLGVPVDWIVPALADYYAGLGRPLGVPALDPANPPMFESQATFLDRHGLLLPGERQRLKPADFRPEPITEIFDLEPRE